VCVDQTQELLGSDDPDMDVNDMEIQKFEWNSVRTVTAW
jgi:hypothetical protein